MQDKPQLTKHYGWLFQSITTPMDDLQLSVEIRDVVVTRELLQLLNRSNADNLKQNDPRLKHMREPYIDNRHLPSIKLHLLEQEQRKVHSYTVFCQTISPQITERRIAFSIGSNLSLKIPTVTGES